MGAYFAPMALTAAGGFPSDPVVVATGISLVFLILVVLTLIILLQGKIFDSIAASKKAKAEQQAAALAAAEPKKAAPAPAAAPARAAAPAPYVEEGIPAEVVAAIAAAVACMDGGKYTLRSLTRAKDGRGAWGLAGVISGTDPF